MTERSQSELSDALADMLGNLGWESTGDAQWSRLHDALPEIAALLADLTPSYVLTGDMVPGSHPEYGAGLFATADAVRLPHEPGARCTCGDPTILGSVHRTDGPCYQAEPDLDELEALPLKAISAICHAISDNCVMVDDPERPPCNFDNCAAVKAWVRAQSSKTKAESR